MKLSSPARQIRPLSPGSRVVIVRRDHLGDLVLTTPLVRALARAGHVVDMIVPKTTAAILENNPHLGVVQTLESLCPKFPSDWFSLARHLRSGRYDLIILPHARPVELLLAGRASGIPRRLAMWAGWQGRLLGYACLRSGLPAESRPFSRIMLDFATMLGVPDAGLQPDVILTSDEINASALRMHRELPECSVFVGIHPGCAGNTCNLPSSAYAELAGQLLGRPNIGIVITGSPAERSLVESWPLDLLNSPRVWNSMGTLTLRELAGVIDQLQLYIVPSTGPLHIASARGVATLSAFCPRSPLNAEIWGNRGGTSLVESPAESSCEQRAAAGHCDFCGEICLGRLAARAFAYLDSASRPQ